MFKIIDFFIKNAKLNYVLLVFVVLGGIYSYQFMSKEIFPPIVMDKILITGNYSGTSAKMLDKMVVGEIEDEINNIAGISKITSSIYSNLFEILVEISDTKNKDTILQNIKDAISKVRQNLPQDMNEPTANHIIAKFPLVLINISSDKMPHDFILNVAKELKTNLSSVKDLSDIAIYGEGKKRVLLEISTDKLKAFDINPSSLLTTISGLSSIFPIGKISQKEKKHYFISTYNGAKTPDEFLETILRIDGKIIRLKDIAKITKGYKNDQTISSFNGRKTIILNVTKSENGNAIELFKKVKQMVDKTQAKYPNLHLGTFSNTSVYIKNRLDTVISNITLSLILVGASLFMLVNRRISFIVLVGIPTSFAISLIVFYLGGYSINMMSLLGALIALGVIVDDAIIVAENIARHINETGDVAKAVSIGTKEVFVPVLTSSLTTIFAFLPMLLIKGEMGVFIKIIPICISVLILASLIESFVFLPLHAKHMLKATDRQFSWDGMLSFYTKMIGFSIRWKKITILAFYIIVPFLFYVGFSQSKFQLFPPFDGEQMNISAKLPINTSLEESFAVVSELEQILLANKDKYFIENITTMAGFRMEPSGENGELGSNYFNVFIDLKRLKPDNFVTKYITPYLSFDYDLSPQERALSSFELENIMQKDLFKFIKKYNFTEFEVKGPRAGIANVPIEIYFESKDTKTAHFCIEKIEKALLDTNKTHSVKNNAVYGISEIKLKVNKFAQSLGINEKQISNSLSGYFLETSVTKGFDENGIFDIVISDIRKDSLMSLKNFPIYTNEAKVLPLYELVDFIEQKNYQKIHKEQGNRRYLVASELKEGANVNEVLNSIKPFLSTLEKENGIRIIYGGEEEQNNKLKVEFTTASLVALFLMFMTLLMMFNSFAYTLMIISVIPFSILGVFFGHFIMGLELSISSIIGALGLAGVVINDGIIMLDFIRSSSNLEQLLQRAKLRLRPIFLTSLTTLIGLSTLIFFPSGQAVIMQPLAVSLGFGLLWGTFLNLVYLPTLFALVKNIKDVK